MTQSTTLPEQAATTPRHPAEILMDLIVALLTPMFLGVSNGDIGMARMAAAETVNTYCARNNVGLIFVAQIIAFGLAALGSLSLSMADDISINMALRLRGNANACNRSAEQNRRALRDSLDRDPLPPPAPAQPEEFISKADLLNDLNTTKALAAKAHAPLHADGAYDPAPRPAPRPAPQLATHPAPQTAQAAEPTVQSPERRNQEIWAIAMAKEATELQKSIASLPPAERARATMQAAALSDVARDLLAGTAKPPSLRDVFPAPPRS